MAFKTISRRPTASVSIMTSGGSGLEYPLSMKLYPRKNRYWISRRIDKINAILNAI